MKNAFLNVALFLGALISGVTIAQTQRSVMIPAGTPIRVRTIDPIDLDSARPGAKFKGSLADPATNNGDAIVATKKPKVRDEGKSI
jgi:hypothetical protein